LNAKPTAGRRTERDQRRLTSFREAILRTFAVYPPPVSPPFASMKVTELKPPNYASDWLVTTVDPNGFLGGYKEMDAIRKQNDLLLNEPVGDVYWVRRCVRCGLECTGRLGMPVPESIEISDSSSQP
jgi:hypothetical protein